MPTMEGTEELASLTAKCSKILEALEEGRKTAGEITGSNEAEKEVTKKATSSNQLNNLRHLVDSIAWGVRALVGQLNRIQNQL